MFSSSSSSSKRCIKSASDTSMSFCDVRLVDDCLTLGEKKGVAGEVIEDTDLTLVFPNVNTGSFFTVFGVLSPARVGFLGRLGLPGPEGGDSALGDATGLSRFFAFCRVDCRLVFGESKSSSILLMGDNVVERLLFLRPFGRPGPLLTATGGFSIILFAPSDVVTPKTKSFALKKHKKVKHQNKLNLVVEKQKIA